MSGPGELPQKALLRRIEAEEALLQFLEDRRQEVRNYVERRFSFQRIWELHRSCFKSDVLINLINSSLAIPLMTPRKIIVWLDHLGFAKTEGLSNKLPNGIPTLFQKELEKSLRLEFFGTRGPFQADPELERSFQELLRQEVREFSRQRASTTDLLASVLPLGLGYLLFSQATHTAAEIGRQVASVFARKQAVDNFFLGESLGSAFYSVVPVDPTANEVMIATAGVFVILAIVSIFIHLVSDPLQNRLGVHERKLGRLLNSMEMKLLLEVHRSYRKSNH